jgi:purine-nucleoside phosphorylase
MTAAAEFLRERLGGLSPRYGIVLGSGLGSLVEAVTEAVRIAYADIPGFPVSSVSGHAGELVVGRLGDVPVVILSGRAHYYESGDANAMRGPIETLKRFGVENLILTNSAGSLREDMPPGSVMRIADHIAFSGANPLIGVESDERFVGMTNAYDAALAVGMEEAAERLNIPLARGVYMWFSGPSFETPAEIRMARFLGADAVGMSTVPEAIVSRHMGVEVLGISCITNAAAGVLPQPLNHDEVMEVARQVRGAFAALLEGIIGRV